ncbi:hypothetical protein C4572_04135 [Candidatus Parcubacteria bacterium]|nr:MAG: hypothetical protein C4572_04135 [Candidatus Parcubacteria bacterium]
MAYRLSDKKCKKLMRRLYFLLKTKKIHVCFKRIGQNNGETDYKIIYLDPREDILATAIHELLHIELRQNTEKEIKKLEEGIMNTISHWQARHFLQKLIKRMPKNYKLM